MASSHWVRDWDNEEVAAYQGVDNHPVHYRAALKCSIGQFAEAMKGKMSLPLINGW
jgi:hypothetical protein